MSDLAIINATDWQVIREQATMMVKSGFLPNSIRTAEQAIAIITLGRELGIPMWASVNTINVIQGKPTISPQLMLALINRSGQLDNMNIEGDATAYTVTMTRKGRDPHTEVFTLQDAATMGLSGKDNWKKQPGTMLKWRAVAACCRVVFADVILGLYTPEEMGADVITDEQGNMTVVSTPTPAPAPPPAPEPVVEAEFTEVAADTPANVVSMPVDGDLRDKDEAIKFIMRWRRQSLTDKDVLEALGVEKLSEWGKGKAAADDAVNAYLAAKLSQESA